MADTSPAGEGEALRAVMNACLGIDAQTCACDDGDRTALGLAVEALLSLGDEQHRRTADRSGS